MTADKVEPKKTGWLWGVIGGVAVVAVAVLLLVPRGETTTRPELPAAPDFPLQIYQNAESLGGSEETTFAAVLAQGKPVVLNFWAVLCGPCRAEMPELQSVFDGHGDEILLVGIDLGPFTGLGTVEQGLALLEELGVTFPAATTDRAEVLTDYGVLGMPSTFFITSTGGVARKWTGPLTESKLLELVDELLAVEEA